MRCSSPRWRSAHVDGDRRLIDLSITQKRVDESPSIDTAQPVSRMLEAQINRYYGYPDYWGFGANSPLWGWGDVPVLVGVEWASEIDWGLVRWR